MHPRIWFTYFYDFRILRFLSYYYYAIYSVHWEFELISIIQYEKIQQLS